MSMQLTNLQAQEPRSFGGFYQVDHFVVQSGGHQALLNKYIIKNYTNMDILGAIFYNSTQAVAILQSQCGPRNEICYCLSDHQDNLGVQVFNIFYDCMLTGKSNSHICMMHDSFNAFPKARVVDQVNMEQVLGCEHDNEQRF